MNTRQLLQTHSKFFLCVAGLGAVLCGRASEASSVTLSATSSYQWVAGPSGSCGESSPPAAPPAISNCPSNFTILDGRGNVMDQGTIVATSHAAPNDLGSVLLVNLPQVLGFFGGTAFGTAAATDVLTITGGTGQGFLGATGMAEGAFSGTTIAGNAGDTSLAGGAAVFELSLSSSLAATQTCDVSINFAIGPQQGSCGVLIPFTFGVPVALDYSFSVNLTYSARTGGPDPMSGGASAAFGDTALVTSLGIYNLDGSLLGGASAIAASGTEYNIAAASPVPVPEPTSVVLLATGLIVTLRRRQAMPS